MRKDYYVASMALTARLSARESCGETSHSNCLTNLDWCQAECAAQNAKRKQNVFVVCYDDHGSVWLALTSKLHSHVLASGGHDE